MPAAFGTKLPAQSRRMIPRLLTLYMRSESAASELHQFHVAAIFDIPDLGSQYASTPIRLFILRSLFTMHLPSIFSAALLVLAKVTDAAPTAAQLTDLLNTNTVEARTTTLVRKEW